jgi:hypothetical protein
MHGIRDAPLIYVPECRIKLIKRNSVIRFERENKVSRNILHTTHELSGHEMNLDRTSTVSLHTFLLCENVGAALPAREPLLLWEIDP